MKHLMIDTETLGQRPGAALLALAVQPFGPRGLDDGGLEWLVSPDSAAAHGHVDPDTVAWHEGDARRAEVLARARREGVSLNEALRGLVKTVNELGGPKVWVWTRGPDFDVGMILRPAFDAVGLAPPWDFWRVRDVRTLPLPRQPRGTVAHTALADARAQARRVAAWMCAHPVHLRMICPPPDDASSA
jgi:hypothetical protein